jgi:hypothetical protein
MQRTGKVAAINAKRGMVAIATEDDAYTIVELLSQFELQVGDVMCWQNGYGLGHELYTNQTRGTSEKVLVQNHAVNAAILGEQL